MAQFIDSDDDLRQAVFAVLYPIDKNLIYCARHSGGYGCTRTKGHDGPHVAHGIYRDAPGEGYHQAIVMWDEGEE